MKDSHWSNLEAVDSIKVIKEKKNKKTWHEHICIFLSGFIVHVQRNNSILKAIPVVFFPIGLTPLEAQV